jgi:hypothetical protein
VGGSRSTVTAALDFKAPVDATKYVRRKSPEAAQNCVISR